MTVYMTNGASNQPQAVTQKRILNVSQGVLVAGRMLYSPATADGTCLVSSADSAVLYGLLLNDNAGSDATQIVDVVVSGRVKKAWAAAGKESALTEPEIAALRAINIIVED